MSKQKRERMKSKAIRHGKVNPKTEPTQSSQSSNPVARRGKSDIHRKERLTQRPLENVPHLQSASPQWHGFYETVSLKYRSY